MSSLGRKTARVTGYLLFYNVCLLLIAYDLYWNIVLLAMVAIDQIVFIADTMIRPPTPRERADITTKLVGLLFILHPFLIALLYYDNLLFTSVYLVLFNDPLISYIGIGVYLIGAAITLTSRVQLGRYGSGVISIEDKHELLTEGIYNHIRNPLYSGALIGRIGLWLAFRGYVVGFLMFLSYFIIFRKRIQIEEDMLESKFGDEFRTYRERTKRLIPYVW